MGSIVVLFMVMYVYAAHRKKNKGRFDIRVSSESVLCFYVLRGQCVINGSLSSGQQQHTTMQPRITISVSHSHYMVRGNLCFEGPEGSGRALAGLRTSS